VISNEKYKFRFAHRVHIDLDSESNYTDLEVLFTVLIFCKIWTIPYVNMIFFFPFKIQEMLIPAFNNS
jgi:hypothetical protein